MVQGVGFRPYVYRLAKTFDVYGIVSNSTDGVHVYLNTSEQTAITFFDSIKNDPPPNAFIRYATINRCESQNFSQFQIIESENQVSTNLVITPDFALCSSCRQEFKDPSNKRFRYAFITCTACGPRFSIQQQLPYDRKATTMAAFAQCSLCLEEYQTPENNRYFSQTNSCPACGILLSEKPDPSQEGLLQENALAQVVLHLKQGKIVAAKGIGGFLLLCDATDEKAIERLRSRKKRPSKPLAILYPDATWLQQDFECNSEMLSLLQAPQAPILLLKPRPKQKFKLAKKALAPGLEKLGVMLPYAPLLELIVADFGGPLVATSANISGSPILFQNHEAAEHLTSIADFILYHNRSIHVPQDDSVWNTTPFSHSLFPIRRSRGYAPSFPYYQTNSGKCILALGALMKSSFSLSLGPNTYVSQYLGSTESYESQQTFRHCLQQFLNLMQAIPELIVTDSHPDYFSHQLAKELALQWKIPLRTVQHHQAHALSVLAENNLLHSEASILCCIWDGTGWGNKQNIWGSEFFLYNQHAFERLNHLQPFPIIAGDKMAREPRLSALSLLHTLKLETHLLKDFFSPTEWNVYTKLLDNDPLIKTDAAGRIFDAFASIIGLIQIQSYEGEAAMLLEEAAIQFFVQNPENDIHFLSNHYNLLESGELKRFFFSVMAWLKEGKSVGFLAAQFHIAMAASICRQADSIGVHHLVCSGGVFMNGLLRDLLKRLLKEKITLYFNLHLPSNDENISFGQLVAGDLYSNNLSTTLNLITCV